MNRLIILSLISFISCSQVNPCQDHDLKKMFLAAVSNNTTAPSYLVFNAINELTGENKEICMASMYFYEVIDPEYTGIDSLMIDYNENCIATFLFKTKEDLEKIRYYQYQDNIVDSLKQTLPSNTIEEIIKEYRKGECKLFDIYIERYSIYFLHYLFKNKILTMGDCETGKIYIQRIY
jgi:hypothetical protein